jgi:hypothetical protein
MGKAGLLHGCDEEAASIRFDCILAAAEIVSDVRDALLGLSRAGSVHTDDTVSSSFFTGTPC